MVKEICNECWNLIKKAEKDSFIKGAKNLAINTKSIFLNGIEMRINKNTNVTCVLCSEKGKDVKRKTN